VSAGEPITIDVPNLGEKPVLDRLLATAADQLLREQNWEALEWICVHPRTSQPLLLELARHPRLHGALGHRSGPPALLNYLADEFDYAEAVLTLAKGMYIDSAVHLAQFRAFLERHQQNSWMLESLLYEREPENPKNAIIDEFCRRHAHSARLLATAERLRKIARARSAHDSDEIKELYETKDPKVWAALAANPQTPAHLLQEFLTVTKIPHAIQIRHAALTNLRTKATTGT
jgi:hypothetical protein